MRAVSHIYPVIGHDIINCFYGRGKKLLKPSYAQKPIILLNIDSLMPHALEVAVQSGRAPALKFLMENGTYIENMVTSFPTMSVTIDSSLLTGTYADQHKIPGLNWFDHSKKQFNNYGTGFKETFRLGVRHTAHNMLYRLNNEHLSSNVTTIYEELATRGISSASINSFVYRGNKLKQLHVPHLLSTLTHFKDGKWTSQTPSIFSLGTFSKLRSWSLPTQFAAGNRKYVAKELRYLIRKNKLPTFTFCIFQDMDTRLHFKGPLDIKGITKIDKEIEKILNMYSSWKEALAKNIWMVIGDNGHSTTGTKRKEVAINLRKVLKKYRFARIGRPIKKKDQLVFSVNQRMSYIYLLDNNISFQSIIKPLSQHSSIDIIAWKDGDSIKVRSGIKDGSLTFKPGDKYRDIYHQSWDLEGDLTLLDVKRINNSILTYGKYPDALARLYGALNSHQGRFIVVNAKPGYEFNAQLTPLHLSGAAHGSLHRQESLVPLIIAGTDSTPKHPRIVDLKDFILRLIVNK